MNPADGADEAFDDIVVGAGASGCVMANRLSADPANRVLLIEAGGGAGNPLIAMPKGIAIVSRSPRWTWQFPVAPHAGPSREESWVRGRVIGGGSSINGMIYSRGHPLDYDDWERLGGDGTGAASTTSWRSTGSTATPLPESGSPPTSRR